MTYRSDSIGGGDHVGDGVGSRRTFGTAIKRLQVWRNVPNSGWNVTPNLGVFGGYVNVEPVWVHHMMAPRWSAVIRVRVHFLVLEVLLMVVILGGAIEEVGQMVVGKNT